MTKKKEKYFDDVMWIVPAGLKTDGIFHIFLTIKSSAQKIIA